MRYSTFFFSSPYITKCLLPFVHPLFSPLISPPPVIGPVRMSSVKNGPYPYIYVWWILCPVTKRSVSILGSGRIPGVEGQRRFSALLDSTIRGYQLLSLSWSEMITCICNCRRCLLQPFIHSAVAYHKHVEAVVASW